VGVTATAKVGELPVHRAGDLAAQPPEESWLIRQVWAREAVGIIGGAPKCCKSWLGLDMAVSVASATRCLDRFEVDAPGASLVYLAEDALPMVRARIDALCQHRGLDIATLDLHVVDVPALRLDLADDQKRLAASLKRLRPRILVLDPLVERALGFRWSSVHGI
jgi:RecA-family ATPase